MKFKSAISNEKRIQKNALSSYKRRTSFVTRESRINTSLSSYGMPCLHIAKSGAPKWSDSKALTEDDIFANDWCVVDRIERDCPRYLVDYVSSPSSVIKQIPTEVTVSLLPIKTCSTWNGGENNVVDTGVELVHKHDIEDLAGDTIFYNVTRVSFIIIKR